MVVFRFCRCFFWYFIILLMWVSILISSICLWLLWGVMWLVVVNMLLNVVLVFVLGCDCCCMFGYLLWMMCCR